MSLPGADRCLAFDIGGANLKAAHGAGPIRTVPFELWKHPEGLAGALAALAASLPDADAWLVTMTGELCDCFRTRSDGVRSILASVEAAAEGRSVRVWGTDGAFHPVAAIREAPLLAAASNWLALGLAVARGGLGRSGLLIDIGSTTTDLIPWRDGDVLISPDRRTDFHRLRDRTLLYRGIRRTPLIGGLGGQYRRDWVPFMAEWFATSADVYVTLGLIPEDAHDRSTANGQPLTVDDARDRLARTVGLDRDDFTAEDAQTLARGWHEDFLAGIEMAFRRTLFDQLGGFPEVTVCAGTGALVGERAVSRLFPGGRIVNLTEAWGAPASEAACAVALLRLVAEQGS